ncbi:PucR family transcriptional regulator [Scopulibacillus cellulosilyticus]|uniref:PucR family transcriptional regulator n=1 Tax=Scopulibacillus cellulosilyticus TaxID=2665665 RepID=A0ABW2Q145_9BACL
MNQLIRSLTVRDLLGRPSFSDAKLVAGHKGCHRKVRWVHIMEVTAIEKFIHGGECILTTGLGLKTFQNNPIQYLTRLLEAGAACLCIELGNDIKEISSGLIDYADQQHFPLIVFNKEVRFVDITQDINSFLIHQHVDQLKAIDKLSTDFNQAVLHKNGEIQVLKLLHEHSHAYILYEHGNEYDSYPVKSQTMFHNDREIINKLREKGSNKIIQEPYDNEKRIFWLVQPVSVLGQTLGYLYLKRYDNAFSEWDKLMTDRAGLVLASNLFQKQLTVERKREREQQIIEDLIHNRSADEETLRDLIGEPWQNRYVYRLIYVDTGNISEHQLKTLQAGFNELGIYPLLSNMPTRLIILAFDFNAERKNWQKVIEDLQKLNLAGQIGISRLRSQLKDVPLSYQEAKAVAKRKHQLNQLSSFYEENGIYQLMELSTDKEVWQRFIYDQIGLLINHDKENPELLSTLKAYLTHQGSKTKTAEALYIVRQTLYHRLERIKSCLGEDFMNPERRIPIEVAIRIYELMKES